VPPSLDLSLAVDNSRLDQTYNTPALATLFLLRHQLEWMLGHGGLSWSTARCARSASVLYEWAEASAYAAPFVAKPDERSNVVGTIDLDRSVPYADVCAVLRENGIVDIEPYRKLGRNQLRVGMFPAVEPADVEALTACIDYVVDRL
jgi:phosphoserine aminotransferase